MTTPDEVLAGADATLDVVDEKIAEERDHWWPGTVTAYDGQTNVVQVDLGPNGGTCSCQNIAGRPWRPGHRVHVVFVKPNAALVIGGIAECDVPYARVEKAGVQGVADGAGGAYVTFDTTVSDRWGMFTGGVRLTAPVTGVYEVSGLVRYQADPNITYYDAELWFGSGARILTGNADGMTTGDNVLLPMATSFRFNGGEYVEVHTFQTSGAPGNRNILATAQFRSFLTMAWTGW